MTKFCGKIGFIDTKETSPGVWTPKVIEKSYTGDVIRNIRRWDSSEYLNDDLSINNSISIVADSFAYDNLYKLKYVLWMGTKWKVTSVEIQRPRLVLNIGGIYNGQNEGCSSRCS